MNPRLTLVPPAEPSDAERLRLRRRRGKPAPVLECHRCGGRELFVVLVGAELRDGKVRGGTRQYLCAVCHRGGERVVLA